MHDMIKIQSQENDDPLQGCRLVVRALRSSFRTHIITRYDPGLKCCHIEHPEGPISKNLILRRTALYTARLVCAALTSATLMLPRLGLEA